MLHVSINLISADPVLLAEPVRYIEKTVRGALEPLTGNLGTALHADHESGALVLESFWASQTALLDGEELTEQGLVEEVQRVNGTVAAHVYEVPVFVPEGEFRTGNAVQLSWMDAEPSLPFYEEPIGARAERELMLEDAIESFGDSAVPEFAVLDGFRGAMLYANWDARRVISETIWRDRRALAASRSAAVAARTTGCVTRETREYQVLFSTARTA